MYANLHHQHVEIFRGDVCHMSEKVRIMRVYRYWRTEDALAPEDARKMVEGFRVHRQSHLSVAA